MFCSPELLRDLTIELPLNFSSTFSESKDSNIELSPNFSSTFSESEDSNIELS